MDTTPLHQIKSDTPIFDGDDEVNDLYKVLLSEVGDDANSLTAGTLTADGVGVPVLHDESTDGDMLHGALAEDSAMVDDSTTTHMSQTHSPNDLADYKDTVKLHETIDNTTHRVHDSDDDHHSKVQRANEMLAISSDKRLIGGSGDMLDDQYGGMLSSESNELLTASHDSSTIQSITDDADELNEPQFTTTDLYDHTQSAEITNACIVKHESSDGDFSTQVDEQIQASDSAVHASSTNNGYMHPQQDIEKSAVDSVAALNNMAAIDEATALDNVTTATTLPASQHDATTVELRSDHIIPSHEPYDIELVSNVDGRSYMAHTDVLAKHSRVLRDLLSQVPAATQQRKHGLSGYRQRISLIGYTSQDIKLILDIIYNRINVKTATVSQQLRLKLLIKRLGVVCRYSQQLKMKSNSTSNANRGLSAAAGTGESAVGKGSGNAVIVTPSNTGSTTLTPGVPAMQPVTVKVSLLPAALQMNTHVSSSQASVNSIPVVGVDDGAKMQYSKEQMAPQATSNVVPGVGDVVYVVPASSNLVATPDTRHHHKEFMPDEMSAEEFDIILANVVSAKENESAPINNQSSDVNTKHDVLNANKLSVPKQSVNESLNPTTTADKGDGIPGNVSCRKIVIASDRNSAYMGNTAKCSITEPGKTIVYLATNNDMSASLITKETDIIGAKRGNPSKGSERHNEQLYVLKLRSVDETHSIVDNSREIDSFADKVCDGNSKDNDNDNKTLQIVDCINDMGVDVKVEPDDELDEGEEIIWVEPMYLDNGEEVYVQCDNSKTADDQQGKAQCRQNYDNSSSMGHVDGETIKITHVDHEPVRTSIIHRLVTGKKGIADGQGLLQHEKIKKTTATSEASRKVATIPLRTASARLKNPGEGNINKAGYVCGYCDEYFADHGELKHHKKLVHSWITGGKDKFVCINCPTVPEKSFCNHRSWLRHQRAVHGLADVSYICDECGKIFYLREELVLHKKRSHGSPRYRCEKCGFMFHRERDLTMHMDVHAPVPQYQCSECGTRFRTMATLAKHQQWHSGIKPHQCPICKRSFFRRNVMRAHMTTHTGTQPHQCPHCPARFAFKDGLQRHVRTHFGNTKHKCTICKDKAFTRPHALKLHMLRRHGLNLESMSEIAATSIVEVRNTSLDSLKYGTSDSSNTSTSNFYPNLGSNNAMQTSDLSTAAHATFQQTKQGSPCVQLESTVTPTTANNMFYVPVARGGIITHLDTSPPSIVPATSISSVISPQQYNVEQDTSLTPLKHEDLDSVADYLDANKAVGFDDIQTDQFNSKSDFNDINISGIVDSLHWGNVQ